MLKSIGNVMHIFDSWEACRGTKVRRRKTVSTLGLLYFTDQQTVSEMVMLVSYFLKLSLIPVVCQSRILSSTRNRKPGFSGWRLFFSFNQSLGCGILGCDGQHCHQNLQPSTLPSRWECWLLTLSIILWLQARCSWPPICADARKGRRTRDMFAFMRKARTFLTDLPLARTLCLRQSRCRGGWESPHAALLARLWWTEVRRSEAPGLGNPVNQPQAHTTSC